MSNAHAMPFGAALGDTEVRFRLWAPNATRVQICLDNEPLDMRALDDDDGWFERVVPGAGPGTRYCYRINDQVDVPDPASRWQPEDVHQASVVIDPSAYRWQNSQWSGRPWHEAVIYELHVGAFTAQGTFDGARQRLDHLVELGVTALELMPIADFSGKRNWGYDGVLPFAPDSTYGTPDDLKRLVDTAHGKGLQIFLDVVYNHFGPDGNYLHAYAAPFFTDRFATPWGAAIDFRRREVRDFVIHNALYWLEEYRFDGLRLDAVHAIYDDSSPDILEELAITVARRFAGERHVHLILENDANQARYLARRKDGRPCCYTAQWNDDSHHALHVLATGETYGYYEDYADRPDAHLARSLAEGFAWQGESSPHRGGVARGEPSRHLPSAAFVNFMQNHDQIGNRAFGERITRLAEPAAVKALAAILLLAPSPPLLFMGEEWAAPEPFPFFCDFDAELAARVCEGRRREFARFPAFQDAAARAAIPDPNAESTFRQAVLDWSLVPRSPHAAWLTLYRTLLALRRERIVPHLPSRTAHYRLFDGGGFCVTWTLNGGGKLSVVANLSAVAARAGPIAGDEDVLYAAGAPVSEARARSELPPWSVVWSLT